MTTYSHNGRIAATFTLAFHTFAAFSFAITGNWLGVIWVGIATCYASMFWVASRDAYAAWSLLDEWRRAS